MKYNIEKNIAYVKEHVPYDRLEQYNEQIKAKVIEELYNKIDEGVCDICEHKDFENDCFKMCNYEVENAKKWLLRLKEQK